MAGISSKGSQRDFDYYDDAGTLWGIRLDESNTRLVNPSGDCGACTASKRLPKNMTPRRVKLIDATNTIPRDCVVLKLATFSPITGATNYTLPATDPNSGTVLAPESKQPEREKNLLKSFDTGLTDGTQP